MNISFKRIERLTCLVAVEEKMLLHADELRSGATSDFQNAIAQEGAKNILALGVTTNTKANTKISFAQVDYRGMN